MTSSYVALKSPLNEHFNDSPLLSPRVVRDSDDSLRDLELSEGPRAVNGRYDANSLTNTRNLTILRPRSYSVGGFDFQHDLLPLSASVTDPEIVNNDTGEKSIGLFNG